MWNNNLFMCNESFKDFHLQNKKKVREFVLAYPVYTF